MSLNFSESKPIHFTQDEEGNWNADIIDKVDIDEMKKIGVMIVPVMGAQVGRTGAALLHTLNANKDFTFSEVLVVSVDDLYKPKSLEEQLKEQSKIPIIITREDIEDMPDLFIKTPKESYKDKHVQNYHIHKTPKTQAKKPGKR